MITYAQSMRKTLSALDVRTTHDILDALEEKVRTECRTLGVDISDKEFRFDLSVGKIYRSMYIWDASKILSYDDAIELPNIQMSSATSLEVVFRHEVSHMGVLLYVSCTLKVTVPKEESEFLGRLGKVRRVYPESYIALNCEV